MTEPTRDDAATTTLSVTVGILTYKRPDDLRRGVPEVLAQAAHLSGDPGITVDVLVIDNDPEGSAIPVLLELSSPRLRSVVEQTPGIAAARNRALAETSRSDVLVFVDDDEMPQPGWLRHLVETWQQFRGTAVMGRVQSTFKGELDAWVTAGDFFWRKSMPTGTAIPVAAAGNLLLDLAQLRDKKITFDETLGMGGGEDTLLSCQITKAGGQIIWCDEALCIDHVPASRTTRRWVLTRAWSHGNTTTTVALKLSKSSFNSIITRAKALGGGGARIGGGLLRWSYGLLTQSLRHQARGLRTASRGGGMASGALGHRYREYDRAKKSAGVTDPE